MVADHTERLMSFKLIEVMSITPLTIGGGTRYISQVNMVKGLTLTPLLLMSGQSRS